MPTPNHDLTPTAQAAVDRVHRLAYSPAEAAQALGLSRSGVYNLLAAGEIASVTLGRRRLIAHSEITRVLGGDAA